MCNLIGSHGKPEDEVRIKEGDFAKCRCSVGNLARSSVVRSRILPHRFAMSPLDFCNVPFSTSRLPMFPSRLPFQGEPVRSGSRPR